MKLAVHPRANHAILAVLVGNILALTSDSTMSWSSPVIPKITSNDSDENPLGRPVNREEVSWIGSLVTIGAMVGPLPGGMAADYFGRKPTLLFLGIPHIASFVMLALAQNIGLFYFARILGGFSVGAVYTIMPMYVGEVAEDSNRGMLLSSINVFYAMGNLVPYVIGPYTSLLVFNLILAAIPAAFVVMFYATAPETPYLHVKKDDLAKAERSLMRLRSESTKGVSRELEKIKKTVEEDQKGSLKDLFGTRGGRKAFIISVVLIAVQQFSGNNAIIFYTETIFSETGSSIPPEIASITLGSVQVLASFVAPLLVDKHGRRILLIISGLGMTLSLGVLGAFYYIQEETTYNSESILWLPVVSLVGYLVAFNIGFGPLPWCITGEIFASNVKALAISLTTVACWTCGFLTAKYFLALKILIGNFGCFWLFAAFCLLGSLFVFFCLPETRGKSFTEIQTLFS